MEHPVHGEVRFGYGACAIALVPDIMAALPDGHGELPCCARCSDQQIEIRHVLARQRSVTGRGRCHGSIPGDGHALDEKRGHDAA